MPNPDAPLLILDAIGPFMSGLSRHRVNWSKIDFTRLERNGRLDPLCLEAVDRLFPRYCARIAADGANAIALDDLAHLYLHPGHSIPLLKKLETYRAAYSRWFAMAANAGLDVYLNTDILFHTPDTLKEIGTRPVAATRFLCEACESVLRDFPAVRGIFFRLGECDGQDVRGDFHSKLILKTPKQANRMLRELLPVFEQLDRKCILRTWTVGAYPIGDLIWNADPLERTLDNLDSSALMLSMKYGESDFFRHLPLNNHFFLNKVPKLVELQTKREYEGSGEYPSFVGFDYEQFLQQLEGAENIVGAHLWCQSGGWTCFRRLSYLEPAGIWNEINTFVTLRMIRDHMRVEEAVAAFAAERLPDAPVPALLELLRLSDEVIKELLYLDEFARQPVYFRRARIPPQLMVYWDHIFVNHTLRKVLRCFVHDPESKVRQATGALKKIDKMRTLADTCGLPVEDIDFMRDTFAILAAAREYALLPHRPVHLQTLRDLKQAYKKTWTHRYRYAVKLDFERQRLPRDRFRLLLRLFFRRERDYRRLDKILTVWLLGKLYPLLRLGGRRFFTFANKQAMGIGSVFR
ncbi:MAG: hypothetical protein LAT83_00425 [Kiritimatiellae bacterium]|nr:hypothetical protein [Kiritimatiellia bacterium]